MLGVKAYEPLVPEVDVDAPEEFFRRMSEANTSSTGGGIGAGGWVAIIISIVAVLALAAFAAWYFLIRKPSGSMMGGPMEFGAGAGSYEAVGKWTFKSLIYGPTPDYIVDKVTTGAYMGPTTTWRKEGNPLGLTWLSWGIIGTVVVLAIVGISLGIAGAAGAFNGASNSNSTPVM